MSDPNQFRADLRTAAAHQSARNEGRAGTDVDVVVVGGGPGGTAAAIELARSGRSVAVVDKASFPRDKCCGDGLTAEALRRLRHLGLDPRAVASWTDVDAARVRSPGGRTVRFPMPAAAGYAAVARRADLDAALLDRARAEGAKVHDGHAVTAVRSVDGGAGPGDGGGVELECEGLGALRASYVVAADGMWSTVRKLTGAADEGGYLGEWHAFRQYFTDVSAEASSQLWVWFEPDLLPGYAWSFPLGDGRANVGFGIRRHPGQPTRVMKEQWTDLLQRDHIRSLLGPAARPESPHKAWPIPARVGSTALSALDGRVLFAGDAARATDPLTGEGIGQALMTGQAAAAAILATGPFDPATAARRYSRHVTRDLATDHRLAATLSGWLASPAVADLALRLAGGTDWTRRNFARWLFEDYPRAVLATPSRWSTLRRARPR